MFESFHFSFVVLLPGRSNLSSNDDASARIWQITFVHPRTDLQQAKHQILDVANEQIAAKLVSFGGGSVNEADEQSPSPDSRPERSGYR
ncbi:hypothetical protein ACK9YZ_03215 [Rhizobium sp. ZK1]|uniref:hypothetical protein n=1 Tax=Rhizobium sp. ZK1 TaxID=3389872 RepID=UPI0039F67DFD